MPEINYKYTQWSTYFYIQGVPGNMIVARRLESRLRFGKLLVTFNLQPDLTCNVLETKIANLS